MTRAMNSHEQVRVVNDQMGTPTYAPDLAAAILRFIDKNDNAKSFFGKNSATAYGIYHFTNEGQTNWHEFASEIYRLGRKYGRITNACRVDACTTEEYGAKVQRPAYSVLSKAKISKALKIKIPEWQVSLEKFMKSERFRTE